MPKNRLLATALLLGAVALSRSAGAGDDKETAKALFERGLEQMEAKRYDEACPAIEQSLKLDPYPGTLFTLAECEALRGRPLAAIARYTEYLELHASLPRAKQLKQGSRDKDARTKKAELEQSVAGVTLTLPTDAPPGVVVTRDGVTLGADQLGSPVRLDPGEHVVTTEAPGGPLTEQRFSLGKGEKREIALEVRKAPAAPKPGTAPPPPPGMSGRRVAAFVTGGVGVAGLVLGAVTGGLMLAQQDAINAGCKDSGAGVALCNAAGAAAGNDAKLFGAVASAGFIAGLAGAGVSIALFATEPKPIKSGATANGSVEVGVQVGPAGMTAGVRGSF